MTPVRRALRAHLNGSSLESLENRCGIALGVLSKILNGRHEMSPRTAAKLDAELKWDAECWAEIDANFAKHVKACHGWKVGAGKLPPFNRAERVAELKATKPIYARAWG